MIQPQDRELRVRRGQVITAAHHNGLVDFAERIQLQRGALKGRSEPGGFTPHVRAQVVVRVEHPFRILLVTEHDLAFVTIDPGYVNGIMPEMDGDIDSVPLDKLNARGEVPRLAIPQDAWVPYGTGERALVFLRYQLNASFLVHRVTPVSLAQPPPAVLPRQWHKLLAVLYYQTGVYRVRQRVFFDQYFTASGGTSAGRFTAWPRCAG